LNRALKPVALDSRLRGNDEVVYEEFSHLNFTKLTLMPLCADDAAWMGNGFCGFPAWVTHHLETHSPANQTSKSVTELAVNHRDSLPRPAC
jgi:hypothetical protein